MPVLSSASFDESELIQYQQTVGGNLEEFDINDLVETVHLEIPGIGTNSLLSEMDKPRINESSAETVERILSQPGTMDALRQIVMPALKQVKKSTSLGKFITTDLLESYDRHLSSLGEQQKNNVFKDKLLPNVRDVLQDAEQKSATFRQTMLEAEKAVKPTWKKRFNEVLSSLNKTSASLLQILPIPPNNFPSIPRSVNEVMTEDEKKTVFKGVQDLVAKAEEATDYNINERDETLEVDTRFSTLTNDGYTIAVHPWAQRNSHKSSTSPQVSKQMELAGMDYNTLAVAEGTIDITFPTVTGSTVGSMVSFDFSKSTTTKKKDERPSYEGLTGDTYCFLYFAVSPPESGTPAFDRSALASVIDKWNFRVSVGGHFGLGRKAFWREKRKNDDGNTAIPGTRTEFAVNVRWSKFDIDGTSAFVQSEDFGMMVDFEVHKGKRMYFYFTISQATGEVKLWSVAIGW